MEVESNANFDREIYGTENVLFDRYHDIED